MVRIRFFSIIAALGVTLMLVLPGCDELITEQITEIRYGLPIAEFEITGDDSNCLVDTFHVVFKDLSQGRPVRWEWNFGDSADNPDNFKTIIYSDDINNTENNGDTSHDYISEGAFTVSLTIFDTLDGPDNETKKRAVIVGQSYDSWTISDDSVCPGELATFTLVRPYGVDSVYWYFGDSVIRDRDPIEKVRTHSWENSGEDTVILGYYGGCGTLWDTILVTVMSCGEPQFTVTPEGGCAPLNVVFVNETPETILDDSGVVVSTLEYWEYDFGDGSVLGDGEEPTTTSKRYVTAGIYEVSLKVRTDLKGETTHYDTIVVLPGLGDFSFTASPTQECKTSPSEEMWVAFKREPSGDYAWEWDFGDSTPVSFLQKPYHAYTDPGEYTVTLTAWGVCGNEDSIVQIFPTPIVFADQLSDSILFTGVQDSIKPNFYTFDDESDTAAVVFHRVWDFGDESNTDSRDSLQHEFLDTGSFWVKLSRSNTCGAVADSMLIVIDSIYVP